MAFAYGMAWVATALAVSVGIYYTKDGTCLWALIFPLCISVKTSGSKDKEEVKDKV